jgi:1,4-alpha-glucan branching enzyme
MLTKEAMPDRGIVRVTFSYPSESWAESVHLVGDFNNWDRQNLPLIRPRHGDADWTATVELKSGQTYQFRYLINAKTWVNDCNADDYTTNPFGGSNSVVRT